MSIDETKLQKLEATLANPARPLAAMVPVGSTPEQQAISTAAAAVRRLVGQGEYPQVFSALVTFRQGYVAAYRRLQELLARESEEARPALTEDFFVGTAMQAAEAPFTEHVLMEGLTQAMTWMIDVTNEHVDADRAEDRAEARQEEQKRRTVPVPIGFSAEPLLDSEAPLVLGRERGLILVGWQPALAWLFAQVAGRLLAETAMLVLHLVTRPPDPALAAQARYVPLARNHWEGVANSRDRFTRVLTREVLPQLPVPPDLLLCDDLGAAYTASYTGRPRGASAGDAHKQFQRWCGAAGCGFLAGLPLLEPELPDLRTPEYEQLRAFATLRGVLVVEEDEHYRITIGGGSIFTPPKAEVDAFQRRVVLAGPAGPVTATS